MANPSARKVDVVYDPDGRPVCPHCFSAPSVAMRAERARAGRRGAKLRLSSERIDVDGQSVAVLVTVYPCANSDCRTDLVVRAAVASPGVTADLLAPFRARHQLSARQLHDYLTGQQDRKGVWRQASLFADRAPPPPKPRRR